MIVEVGLISNGRHKLAQYHKIQKVVTCKRRFPVSVEDGCKSRLAYRPDLSYTEPTEGKGKHNTHSPRWGLTHSHQTSPSSTNFGIRLTYPIKTARVYWETRGVATVQHHKFYLEVAENFLQLFFRRKYLDLREVARIACFSFLLITSFLKPYYSAGWSVHAISMPNYPLTKKHEWISVCPFHV